MPQYCLICNDEKKKNTEKAINNIYIYIKELKALNYKDKG
jgi:hypothetical protein